MNLLDLTGVGPYIKFIEIGAIVAVVAAGVAWLEHDGGERVQRKWDAAKATAVIERDQKLFTDTQNNTLRDTSLQQRVDTSTKLDTKIIERIVHVPVETACTRLPAALGVLLNSAALGIDPVDAAPAGQPDGAGAAASGVQPAAARQP